MINVLCTALPNSNDGLSLFIISLKIHYERVVNIKEVIQKQYNIFSPRGCGISNLG